MTLRGLHQRARCARRDSTIHKQDLPCDIAAGLRSEEYDRRIQILRLSRSFGSAGNSVARRKTGHAVTDRGNSTRSFVAHDNRRDAPPRGAIVAVDVAAADAACRDPDKNLTGNWRWRRNFRNFQMAVFRK